MNDDDAEPWQSVAAAAASPLMDTLHTHTHTHDVAFAAAGVDDASCRCLVGERAFNAAVFSVCTVFCVLCAVPRREPFQKWYV